LYSFLFFITKYFIIWFFLILKEKRLTDILAVWRYLTPWI